MGQDAVRLQAASALDAVVHVERLNNGRAVASIGVLEDGPAGLVVGSALDIHSGAVRGGPAWPRLAVRLGLDPTDWLTAGWLTTDWAHSAPRDQRSRRTRAVPKDPGGGMA